MALGPLAERPFWALCGRSAFERAGAEAVLFITYRDRIQSGDFSIDCAGNVGTCIDLDGSTGMAGRFETVASFNFVPGTTYRLSFDLSGNQRTARRGW